jgi:hypothetical protein
VDGSQELRETEAALAEPGSADGVASSAQAIPRSGRSALARRAVGRRVLHETFGPGTVLEADGDGAELKLTVRFTGAVKKVYARFVTGIDGAGDGD